MELKAGFLVLASNRGDRLKRGNGCARIVDGLSGGAIRLRTETKDVLGRQPAGLGGELGCRMIKTKTLDTGDLDAFAFKEALYHLIGGRAVWGGDGEPSGRSGLRPPVWTPWLR